MTPAARRILAASTVLLVLLVGLAGLALSPASPPRSTDAGNPNADAAPEASRLTEEQAKTFAFFNEGRVATGDGRGLFETDFFKPAPPPKPVPKPAPPTTRELVLFYRGLAAFPDGGRVAYFAVEGRTVMLGLDDVVAAGWKVAAFDGERATLAKDDKQVELPFNRRSTLSVPVKP